MMSYSARRLVPACVISAATVAAMVAPGAASAAVGQQCSGVSVIGQGASTQKLAQQNVWTPDFKTKASKAACSGTQGSKGTPSVKYESTGSGAGLKSWGAEPEGKFVGFAPTNAYLGTDEPPNASQKKEIEEHETTLTPQTLETVPVLQVAVSVIAHLPVGCTSATSKFNKGRLELNNVTLEGIYRGTINKWSQLKDGGDLLTCSSKAAEESAITPVVRLDQSGTTHIFKKYLSLIDKSTFLTEKGGNKDWTEVSEGGENTDWPTGAKVMKAETSGGGGLVATVAKNAGTIGYASVADARANAAFKPAAGGPTTATFWMPIQDNGVSTEKPKYADPADNKEVAALGNANCKKTIYTNSEEEFPPASTKEVWNEVTTSTKESKYTICGLTYDLGFSSYGVYPGTESGEATTVHDYLSYVLNTAKEGGQKEIKGNDFLELPKGPVLSEAQKGASELAF